MSEIIFQNCEMIYMSMGRGGGCFLVSESETAAEYSYYSYDLDSPEHRNEARLCDGLIAIDKAALPEADIHIRIKRGKNGKKRRIEKRIAVDTDLDRLIAEKRIRISNTSNVWRKLPDGTDIIASSLCRKIFRLYQENGELPQKVYYDI